MQIVISCFTVVVTIALGGISTSSFNFESQFKNRATSARVVPFLEIQQYEESRFEESLMEGGLSNAFPKLVFTPPFENTVELIEFLLEEPGFWKRHCRGPPAAPFQSDFS